MHFMKEHSCQDVQGEGAGGLPEARVLDSILLRFWAHKKAPLGISLSLSTSINPQALLVFSFLHTFPEERCLSGLLLIS